MSNRSDADFHTQMAIVNAITQLTKKLPSSVPEGKRDEKLYRVMTNDNYRGETPRETFNKHFDATFGEDCQNAEGCLKNVCHGQFGMDIVTKYLHIAIDMPRAQAFHAPMMPTHQKEKKAHSGSS